MKINVKVSRYKYTNYIFKKIFPYELRDKVKY